MSEFLWYHFSINNSAYRLFTLLLAPHLHIWMPQIACRKRNLAGLRVYRGTVIMRPMRGKPVDLHNQFKQNLVSANRLSWPEIRVYATYV